MPFCARPGSYPKVLAKASKPRFVSRTPPTSSTFCSSSEARTSRSPSAPAASRASFLATPRPCGALLRSIPIRVLYLQDPRHCNSSRPWGHDVVLGRADERPEVCELVVHPGAVAVRFGDFLVLDESEWYRVGRVSKDLRTAIEAVVGRWWVDRVIFPHHSVPKCSMVDKGWLAPGASSYYSSHVRPRQVGSACIFALRSESLARPRRIHLRVGYGRA